MNWQKLFKAQAELDKHIKQGKGLEGHDLLDKKILALLVELGELANEWRGFKFWSEDQEPRALITYDACSKCSGLGFIDDSKLEKYIDCTVPNCLDGELTKNPLLEEYVDCLHFILSIGNYIGVKSFEPINLLSLTHDITGQFIAIYKLIGKWEKVFLFMDHDSYHVVVNEFLMLGEMLGFTEQQIEDAYFKKNAINHDRQENNY